MTATEHTRSSTTKITKRCSCPPAYDGDRRRVPCPRLREARHGSWGFVVDLGTGPDGKRRQLRRGGFPTKAAAEVELTRLRRERDAGTYTDARGITVGSYLAGWLARKVSAGELRPTTARSYRGHLDGHLLPHLGRLPLGDLRVNHVDQLLDHIRSANATSARPVGPATQRRIVATLRSALSDAVSDRLLSWNPASHAKIAKATRPKVHPWSAAEVSSFLDAVVGERDAALWHLAVFSGLRRGELCGLRWTDLELDAARLVVRQQATQVGHEVVYGPPKTASGDHRVVSLDAVTVAVLRSHKAATAAELSPLGTGVHRLRPGLRPRGRGGPAPRDGHPPVRPAGDRRRAPPGAAPRSQARVRQPGHGGRGAAPHREQAARAQLGCDHLRHVQPPAGRSRRGGRGAGGRPGAPADADDGPALGLSDPVPRL